MDRTPYTAHRSPLTYRQDAAGRNYVCVASCCVTSCCVIPLHVTCCSETGTVLFAYQTRSLRTSEKLFGMLAESFQWDKLDDAE